LPVIVSINQPAYLPWLGYFHRIAASDLHVVLDHVQFEKNSFTNRNKIRTQEGWCWLTVPVKTKGLFGRLGIDQLECADEEGRWRRKHWTALRTNYGRTPHFGRYAGFLEEAYSRPWARIADLLKVLTQHLCAALEIRRPILFSSELGVDGVKDELILNICRAVDARVYLSGPFGRNYLREDRFRKAGVEVAYQDYRHPVYRQAFPGFEPCMSSVDLLFNCGPESKEVLMRDQEVKAS
jgi:hypothetical protein